MPIFMVNSIFKFFMSFFTNESPDKRILQHTLSLTSDFQSKATLIWMYMEEQHIQLV